MGDRLIHGVDSQLVPQLINSMNQVQIHTVFYRFTEISQIFHNVSGTQEMDFESPKCYLGQHAPDPS